MHGTSRRLAVVVAAWLTASAGGTAGADVGDYLGKRIASVRIVLEGHDTTDASLVQAVATEVGRPLSMAEVRDSVSHLFSLGRFDDVRVDAALDAGGVALRFDLSPIHPVTKIVFAGKVNAPGVSTGALRQAVVGRYGVSPPLGRAADVARLVADSLQERGYLHSTVTPRADLEHAPDRATLVLTIDPGSRTTIGTVDLVDTSNVSRAELLSKLRIAPGAPYERDALAARTARYVEDRRKHGYYEAKVIPSVSLTDDGRTANLTVTVNPGPHMRVVFAGDPLPSDQRTELVPVDREGSADEDLLEDSSRRIEEYLKGQGYRDASAPHTRQSSGDELLITFTVAKGHQYRVDRVTYSGNSSMALAEFEPMLRLRNGQPYADARLDADILLIEELYHRRGFASAKAQPSIDVRTPADGDASAPVPVTVTVVVREGSRTTVGSVQFEGNRSLPESTVRPVVGLQAGGPYSDAQARVDSAAVQSHYADLGYQNVTVELKPNFSDDGARADPVFVIHEGPRILVDHITIVGNVRTSTEMIRRELQIKEGDPLSLTGVTEAQRRLASLGLFRRTRITELGHGNETTRDLLVTVEEAPVTTIGYGGGGEVRLRVVRRAEGGGVAAEKLEFGPRASFQIGRRNLFGKNRSVNIFTSFGLYPRDSPVFAGQSSGSSSGGFGFSEYRILGTFREPRVFDTAADLSVTGSLEQQIRSSFNFARRGAGVQVGRRLTRELSVSGNYQIQRTRVFDQNVEQADQLLVDRAFPQVRLSSFAASVIGDTRDDAVNPGSGHYWSANGQLSARAIGSEVVFHRAMVSNPGAHASRRLRRRRAARAGHRFSARCRAR
jgi:outer membrane protein assembly factor BamA